MGTCWESWGRSSEEEKPAQRYLWLQTLPDAAPSEVRTSLSVPLLEGQTEGSQVHRDGLAPTLPSVIGNLGKLTSLHETVYSPVKRGLWSPAPKVVVKFKTGSMNGKHSDLARAVHKKGVISPSASQACERGDQKATDIYIYIYTKFPSGPRPNKTILECSEAWRCPSSKGLSVLPLLPTPSLVPYALTPEA